jgi:curli biogenesis system outer membrane secretion channel CsgG
MQMASGAGGSGQIPVIAITLRIIDAATGEIVWAINAARSGSDKETVFGIGKIRSLNTLADDMAKQIAQAFADSLGK